MSFLDRLFRRGSQAREDETNSTLEEVKAAQRQNLQIVQSAGRVTKRRSQVMQTMAGAMQMTARGDNEDR